MAPLEMAEFMREHRFDLAAREAREQRVEEDDALCRAKARENRRCRARSGGCRP